MIKKRLFEDEELKERQQRFAKIWWQSRADAGKSQEYIALELGVSRKTIQNWEKGTSSPSFFQGTEWFKALGLNPMPYYLSFLFPNGLDGIKRTDSDKRIEEALNLLVNELSPEDKRRLLYALYGNHGSSPRAVLNLLNAHLQTPFKDRIVQASMIMENYEMEAALGEIVRPEHIQPDIDLLHRAISLAKEAVIKKQQGYSITDNDFKPNP